MIQPLGFIDTSTFAAWFVAKHRQKARDGVLALRDIKADEIDPADLAIMQEWKGARALLSRLRAAAAPFFNGVTPELGKAWIEVLPPLAGTPWTSELDDYAAAHVRTRTCLIPSPGAISFCGTASAMLHVGMVNQIDHSLLCSEVNHGEHARVHLVVDVRVPDADPA